MRRRDINERSPLRLLESSIHGGLGKGNIAAVVARHGVGKTAFLVGVALDDLMRGHKVLHVSLKESSERVRSFYDDIFMDLSHEKNLEDVWKVRLDLERNRRIHCYLDGTFSIDKLRSTIDFLRDHGDFRPVTIMLDGFPLEDTTADEIDALRAIAVELEAELWMTAVNHREPDESDDGKLPVSVNRLAHKIDVILGMAHDTKAVHISILKDHDNPDVPDLKLALDPTTLLLQRES